MNKIILIFHIGNINVLEEIITKFPIIKNIQCIITFYNDDYKNKFKNYFNNIIKLIKVENKGADCGPMLIVLKYLFENIKKFSEETIFLKIHTKTIENWRNNLISEIINSEKNNFDFTKPFIFGSDNYLYSDEKGVNREYIMEILKYNNNLLHLYNQYIDHYYNNSRNIYELNEVFYKNYEPDLKNLNNPLEHWEKHGKNEFHRIPNVNCIKKKSIFNNYFIGGTIFGFNKKFINIFNLIDLQKEYSKFEEGYLKNNIPTITHSWEYLFGTFTLLNNGTIYGLKNNKIIRTMENKKIENNNNIKYNLINVPINKSKIAFFLIIPDKLPTWGGYRTLLKYINFLNLNNLSVDIYLGTCWNDNDVNEYVNSLDKNGMPKCNNFFVNNNLDKIIEYIENYKEIDITKNNFYIGLKCQRQYDYIVANAWQIAKPVYMNKKYCNKKLIYIIQDREELFYTDLKMQKDVLSTYKNEFHYFCITKYLENYFKNTYKLSNVYGSNMGVNLNKYFNKNINRENSVVIPYYSDAKPHRKPKLVEKIINILSKNNITCYIFPHNFIKKDRKNIVNLGTLTELELNNLYNKSKVGIIFSNSNISRLPLEMYCSGLNVIEYDCEFTEYDLPNEYFLKIKNKKDILNKVKNLFNKNHNNNYVKNLDINNDYNNFLKIF